MTRSERRRSCLKTFGMILCGAFIASGVNSTVSQLTGAPSLASYSMTHHLAARIADQAPDAPATEAATRLARINGQARSGS